jgi:aspartate racemase
MKTIGLIGGMSWESSAVYYDYINKRVNELMGGFHSAKSIMLSVDFAEIEELQHKGEWNELDNIMSGAAVQLEKAGADFIVLCTNTMHLCSGAIIKSINIPFLHIAEALGREMKNHGIDKAGLLGTRFTMEKDFYRNYLLEHFGIEVIIPEKDERETVHRIIYKELVHGKIMDESRESYKNIIARMEDQGAKGVILGCTEIPLLISESDVNIQVFDTTRIHAHTAVEWALAD